jgi:hypothetical protein
VPRTSFSGGYVQPNAARNCMELSLQTCHISAKVANSTLLIRHIAKKSLLHPAILLPNPPKLPLHGTQPTAIVLSCQDSHYSSSS